MNSEEESMAPQTSPKPGHVQRVQSPVSSPVSATQPRMLSDSDDMNLDQCCIERFLKINVRHITDGQGVVSGVLLVTPNAVMFDPNVSDPLVIEHGAENYGVIAPMDYVINAAMYNDIATMYVSHAPNRELSTLPEVYHAKDCPLLPRNDPNSFSLSEHPSQTSDSERLTVNGSMSDVAEAGTPEEERESLCSCQTITTTGTAGPRDGSEVLTSIDDDDGDNIYNRSDSVFLDDPEQTDVSSTTNKDDGKEDKGSLLSTDDETSAKSKNGRTASDSCCITSARECAGEDKLISFKNVPQEDDDNLLTEKTEGDNDDAILLKITKEEQHEQSISSDDNPESNDIPPSYSSTTTTPSRHPPLTQSCSVTAVAAHREQGLKESLCRQKSAPQQDRKMNVLKRLSYPLTWMECFSGTPKDKEMCITQSPPLSALPEASATLSGGTASDAPSSATLTSSQQQQQQQSTLSKILSTSPRNFVDFSSGLFTSTKTAGEDASTSKPPQSYQDGQNGNFRSVIGSQDSTTTMSPTHSSCQKGQATGKKGSPTGEQRLPSVGDFKEPKVGFKSVVSVDDMPHLFAPIELLENFTMYELIPRPAKPCDDPPLYLCLRMGKRIGRTILASTPMMAYGRKMMKREYWFSIPRDRVDDLYSFFHHWAPNMYGDWNEEEIKKMGYEPINEDEFKVEDERKPRRSVDCIDGKASRGSVDSGTPVDAHNDWEMVSVTDIQRQISFDMELPIPDLIGKTDILEEEHRKALAKVLPARAVGYAWTLIFSTSLHGFSLKSLYRKMAQYDTPVLLVIMDTDNSVFGALTSCTLKVSEHFYGTGESFLFSFYPEFKSYGWTGENLYFIKGNLESMAIGAGEGVFGLWLDGDLNHGRSHRCTTYNNDTLSNKEDFCVKTLEAWGFVEVDTSGL